MRGGPGTLLLCTALAWSAYWLGYRVTASHPYGIYRIVDRPPDVGLYAIFCVPRPVADLPLDRNHPPCTRDTEGYPVLKRIERIENGEYIVLGDHPRSLDSRIFGPLSRSSILAVAMPVWVF